MEAVGGQPDIAVQLSRWRAVNKETIGEKTAIGYKRVTQELTSAMVVSSRSPEGFPSRCPLCNAETALEFSDPAGDAPCPKCGHLLWLSGELLSWFRTRLADTASAPNDRVNADAALAELRTHSLDAVELVMELEEKFDVSIREEVAERIETVGDAIRCIEQSRRGNSGNQ